MFKKYAFWFVLLSTPLFFACAHASLESKLEEETAYQDNNPALSEENQAEFEEEDATEVAEVKELAPALESEPAPSAPLARKTAGSLVPAPLSQAIHRNGLVLNRYYFLRAGDKAEALSKLFYGTSDRAAELAEWNGAALQGKPGTVIYYRSSVQPADTSLLSYYLEAGVPTESVTLENGDTLEKIAQSRYGAVSSAKEIMALNGLKEGMRPAAGTLLKLYPASLSQAETPSLAKAPRPEAPLNAKEEKLASPSLANSLQHHPILIGCCAAALVLGAVLFFIQRRRSRRFNF